MSSSPVRLASRTTSTSGRVPSSVLKPVFPRMCPRARPCSARPRHRFCYKSGSSCRWRNSRRCARMLGGSRNISDSLTRLDDPRPHTIPRHFHSALSLDRDQPIGLVAGAGRFPIAFAEKIRHVRQPLVTAALRDHASAELVPLSTRLTWTGIAKIGRIIRFFKREGVRNWVMAGKVQKTRLIGAPWRIVRLLPDWRALRMWYRRVRDHADDTLLSAVIAEFESEGLVCRSALEICPELLVRAGVLTRRSPTASEWKDIEYGWGLATEMGRLDVGQCVAVIDRAVLAVEAIEGTDRAIARAGDLCPRGGFTAVKVAKPHQDMRFDVPTVGATTIEVISKAGGRVLAIEAGSTILLDEAETIALADQHGISIVAR